MPVQGQAADERVGEVRETSSFLRFVLGPLGPPLYTTFAAAELFTVFETPKPAAPPAYPLTFTDPLHPVRL